MTETLNSQPEKSPGWTPLLRDYWIWDQVVRCGRTQENVALEVSLSQVRVSQICRRMHLWLYEIWGQCLMGTNEEILQSVLTIIGLREAAAHHSALPPIQRVQKEFYQAPPPAFIFPRAGDSGSS